METRSYKIFTVVEAPSEQEAAKVGDYMAFDTIETDSEGKDVEVLEQLEDDVEFVPEGWI